MFSSIWHEKAFGEDVEEEEDEDDDEGAEGKEKRKRRVSLSALPSLRIRRSVSNEEKLFSRLIFLFFLSRFLQITQTDTYPTRNENEKERDRETNG